MSKYKVGDKVLILPLEQLEICEDYVPRMEKYAGRIMTIDYATKFSKYGASYCMVEDNNKFWWHEPMIRCAINHGIDLNEMLNFLDEQEERMH